MPSSIRDLLRLPSRIALLLGLGALTITGAKADTGGESRASRAGARIPQQSVKAFGDLLIWNENGRIYVSEAGKLGEELRLGDTTEAGLLRQLLEREGATAATPHILRDRVILVGGGGDGFHWQPAQKSDNPNKTRTSAASSSASGNPK
jgi:hypothetical protein